MQASHQLASITPSCEEWGLGCLQSSSPTSPPPKHVAEPGAKAKTAFCWLAASPFFSSKVVCSEMTCTGLLGHSLIGGWGGS